MSVLFWEMMTYFHDRLCVPNVDDLWTKIVAEAHGSRYLIHPGSSTMYVAKCPNCQQVKEEHLRHNGLTHMIEFPTWKWEAINMDFVVGLPRTRRQHDSIWVIVDRMTKSAHFIPVKSTYRAKDYARLYIDEILRWNGIHLSIIFL